MTTPCASASNSRIEELSNAEHLVRSLYLGLLHREPDESGLKYYTGVLSSQSGSFQEMLETFVASAEFKQVQRGQISQEAAASAGEDQSPRGCSTAEAMQVFERFQRHTGPGRPGYITNFLGGLTDVRHVGLDRCSGLVESYPIPRNFHAEALEWLGTLQAVLEAKGAFKMIELGAGWAPWCTIGYIAATQLGLEPHVTAVEGDTGHVRFIEQSFGANHHSPANYRIIHGIAGVADGTASFPRVKDASKAYGGAASFGAGGKEDDPFKQFVSDHGILLDDVESLPCYSLPTLLKQYDHVDLIHCDVQGVEADIFETHIDAATNAVSRIIVGTHSYDIDRRLANLFPRHGWVMEGLDHTKMSEEGGVLRTIGDGTQIWRNSRFLPG